MIGTPGRRLMHSTVINLKIVHVEMNKNPNTDQLWRARQSREDASFAYEVKPDSIQKAIQNGLKLKGMLPVRLDDLKGGHPGAFIVIGLNVITGTLPRLVKGTYTPPREDNLPGDQLGEFQMFIR